MQELTTLAIAFGASLAATVVLALLFRIGGKKPNVLIIVAVPVGITMAEAVRLRCQMSGVACLFVLGAAVGLAVFCAQYVKARGA